MDTRHSDAKLTTDATTDYGKTKTNVTLGFARVNGNVTLDEGDPTKSSVDLRIYPATSMSSSDGKSIHAGYTDKERGTTTTFTMEKQSQETGDAAVYRRATLQV